MAGVEGVGGPLLDPQAVRQELHRILHGPALEDSGRLQEFLRFVVEEALEGREASIKESVIGVEVFGRPAGYDPKVDPVVRVQARRLRAKLEEDDRDAGPRPVRIILPKGGYAPEFLGAPVEAPPPVTRPRGKLLVLAAAALVLAAAAAFTMRGNRPAPRPSRIFTAYAGYQTTPVFSPDGAAIAFSWGGENADNVDIYVQRLDADSPRRITTSPATERRPSWLPDGQHIGFLREVSGRAMSVVVTDVLGGGERTIAELQCSLTEPPPLAWSRDGRFLYTSERPAPGAPLRIVEIAVESGARRAITRPPAGIPGDDEPSLSSDGRTVAFRRVAEAALHDVFTVPVAGGAERAITNDHTASGGNAWTRDGRALIVSGRHESSLRSLWRYPLDGGDAVRLTDPTEAAAYPAVSPRDGSIAYASRFLDTNIWRVALDGQSPARRIVASNLLDSCPHYSPDGRRLAFRSNRTGSDELWVAGEEGASPSRLTDFAGPLTGNARWSPDGQYLAIESRPNGNADLFLVPAGGGRPQRLTSDKSNELLPTFSGDGKSLYYACDRSGSWQIWKLAVGGGEPRQVTTGGGFAPLESPDGRWLYYTHRDASGLFRMPIGGGKEETVLAELDASLWGGWGLTGDSVVYLDATRLTVYTPATRTARVVATLPHTPIGWDGALGVTADGAFAAVALVERAGSEIHLKPER